MTMTPGPRTASNVFTRDHLVRGAVSCMNIVPKPPRMSPTCSESSCAPRRLGPAMLRSGGSAASLISTVIADRLGEQKAGRDDAKKRDHQSHPKKYRELCGRVPPVGRERRKLVPDATREAHHNRSAGDRGSP